MRDVCSALLRELGRTNKLDMSDLSAVIEDPTMSRPLDRAVRQQLEPLWHTLTWRSRCANCCTALQADVSSMGAIYVLEEVE
jgi:hypothetical protein